VLPSEPRARRRAILRLLRDLEEKYSIHSAMLHRYIDLNDKNSLNNLDDEIRFWIELVNELRKLDEATGKRSIEVTLNLKREKHDSSYDHE